MESGNSDCGNYYNYCAASAGTNCSDSNSSNTTYDICPKGWRLPTNEEQSNITNYISIFSPVYSGYYNSGNLNGNGSIEIWWSSSSYNEYQQYVLYYSDGSLNATHGDNKYIGNSVRCIRTNSGTLTINFNGNGSASGNTTSQQIAAGNTASLNPNGFTRTGYAFKGWNTAEDGFGIGANYIVAPTTGDTTITLYAQWRPASKTSQAHSANS